MPMEQMFGHMWDRYSVDSRFEPLSGQTKDYKIGIFCFSAKHTVLRSKNKDRLTRN
jgi:hypothetical protein